MRIDLPCCGFKNCRHCFDGNCTKPSEQGKCEYWYILHEEPEIIRCKDCKYFHYDKPYVVFGVPVLGHEVCDKWGDGCKTSENGFCFMAERRGEQE